MGRRTTERNNLRSGDVRRFHYFQMPSVALCVLRVKKRDCPPHRGRDELH